MELYPPQLSGNLILTCLIFIYAIINILAWSKDGIFFRELTMLKDMRNERTFMVGDARHSKIKPILALQYFIFFGLTLFTIIVQEPAMILSDIEAFIDGGYIWLLFCIAAPFVWFCFQYFLFHWVNYIFGGDGRITILDRIYRSTHLLAGTAVMIIFSFLTASVFSLTVATILLSGIFIITQFVFFLSIFKIFFSESGSRYLFLLYLCALEIAPLAVFFVKMGRIL